MDTSIEALQSVPTATLRQVVMNLLKKHPDGLTVHEAAEIAGVSVPSIQPRFSELRKAGAIRDSGLRRFNKVSGRRAAVWVLV